MNNTLSVYLDGVRFLAALIVFLSHASIARFSGEWLEFFRNHGHDGVVVFFVLSGFVIAYVADTKEKDLRSYTISRLARLYSVVLVALLLTVALDFTGESVDAAHYVGEHFQGDHPVLRFLINLFFLNEFWFWSVRAFSNGPFWSMGYEFWYYVIFGVWTYLGGRLRYILLALVMLIIGPKVLLLLPVWLLGVVAYRYTLRQQLSTQTGWVLFIGSIVAYFAFRYSIFDYYAARVPVHLFGEHAVESLVWSRVFVGDYIVGLIVVANFVGLAAVSDQLSGAVNRVAPGVRLVASYTFTLYLLHYPLLQFFSVFFHNSLVIVAATLVSIVAVGEITERRKYIFKTAFVRCFECGGKYVKPGYDMTLHKGGLAKPIE